MRDCQEPPEELRRNHRSPSGLALLGPLLLASCAPAPDVEVVDLALGRPYETCIAGGEAHRYRLRVDAGEFVRLVVDQRGADVVAVLFDGEGETLVEVDGFSGVSGPERLAWIADRAAVHHVEVRVPDPRTAPGCYQVHLAEQRPEEEHDSDYVAAVEVVAGAWSGLEEEPQRVAAGLERNLAFVEKHGDRLWHAETLQALGFVYRDYLERPEEAAEFHRQALELVEGAGYPGLEATILHDLGFIHDRLGEMEAALGYYEAARELRAELGDLSEEAATLNNLGYVYAVLGEVHEAMTCYEQALERWRTVGDRNEEARTLQNRARRYAALGKFDQALSDFREALEIRRQLGDRQGQIITLTGMGQMHEQQGNLAEAFELLKESLEMSRADKEARREAIVLARMGSLYDRWQRHDEAFEAFDRALATFRERQDRLQEAMVLQRLGWHQTSQGRSRTALEIYGDALRLSRGLGDRSTEAAVLLGMAHAERQRGRLLEARRRIEAAIELIEDLRTKPGSQDLRSSYFATKHSYYDFHVDLLMELDAAEPGAGHDRDAFAASERARARSLLESLVESQVDLRRGIAPEILERERTLAGAISGRDSYRSWLLEKGAGAEQTDALDAEIRELLRRYEIVRGEIRKTSPAYASLTRPEPVAVAEIQERLLDAGTVLLEYKLGDRRTYLWMITKDAVSSFELPSRSEIERRGREAYGLLTRSHLTRFRARSEEVLRDLGEMLLGPVADLLDRQRLWVVGEGVLQYIPFGVLPKPGTSGAGAPRLIVEDHEVVTMPSASTLAITRGQLTEGEGSQGVVAVVADPVFSASDARVQGSPTDGGNLPESGAPAPEDALERLVFSRREAAAIRSAVPAGGRSFEALDFDASKTTVMGGGLEGYRIVHFAVHGKLNTEQPNLSGLVLSTVDRRGRPLDGVLHAHEIYSLELPAELVVLSACQTALGRQIRGEGLVGLTRGFMYAGAKRIVVSLWNVNDEATAELMGAFYEAMLGEGLAPAAALREAQEVIRRDPRWSAPFYWGGFVLQGDWEPASFSGN